MLKDIEKFGLVGLSLYEVEWISYWPLDDYGESDPDLAVYEHEYFKDREKATDYAREVLPRDCIGEVKITPCHFALIEKGYIGTHLEYDGEPDFVYREEA